jgi:ANTAR domain
VAVLDQNSAQLLAAEAAQLLSLAGASGSRSLHRLADLAARQVPACSGATAALWRDGEPVSMTATHPDLSELFEVTNESGAGPWQAALATGEMVSCTDTLAEKRWPAFASAALFRGVRCTVTMVRAAPPVAITLTLYAARPGVLDADHVAMAQLLMAFGGTMMDNASAYGDSQRTALQLRDAAEARTVVDQAKGILMHALGCTADEAFARMREVSQRRHVKVTEVAKTIIESHPSDPL